MGNKTMGGCSEAPSQMQSVTQLLRRAVQVSGDNVAIECALTGNTQTYKEMLDSVAKFAAGLTSIGLTKGARVGILSLNSPTYLQYIYAVPWAGGLVLPLNIRLAPPEIVEICLDCTPEYLLVDDAFAKMIPALDGKLGNSFKGFIYCGDSDSLPEGCKWSVKKLIAENTPAEDQSTSGDACVGIFYTGGSTGKPKGVQLAHGSMIWNALGNIACTGFNDKTKYLHCAPMFHLADCQFSFCVTMAGGTHVILDKFSPPGVLEAIQKCTVTASVLVPVMLNFILKMPNLASMNLDSLSMIVYGGSPMAPSLLKDVMKTFPNAKCMQGYGQTECGPAIATLAPEHHVEATLASAGRPVPFAHVKIVDENDNEVPRGTVGEIVIRGPHLMIGYWNQPEDRLKDMIITGGENVYSSEVEACLASFEGQSMCCVIGTPDEKFGELVTAVIQPKEGAEVTLEAVKKHCDGKIAGYKTPRKVVVMEKIPISGAGKILKHEIRKKFWEGHEMSSTFANSEKKTNYT